MIILNILNCSIHFSRIKLGVFRITFEKIEEIIKSFKLGKFSETSLSDLKQLILSSSKFFKLMMKSIGILPLNKFAILNTFNFD